MFEHELGDDSLGLGKEPGLYISSGGRNRRIREWTDRDEDVATRRLGVSSIIRGLLWRGGLTSETVQIPPEDSRTEGRSTPRVGR